MQTEVPLLFSKLQTSCSAITLPPLSSLKANQSLLCVEDLLSGLRRQQKKTLRSFFFEPVVGFCSRKKKYRSGCIRSEYRFIQLSIMSLKLDKGRCLQERNRASMSDICPQ